MVSTHVEANFKAFEKLLPTLLPAHAEKFALMRNEQIIEFFDTALDAYLAGQMLFEDKLFSIQEVINEHFAYSLQAIDNNTCELCELYLTHLSPRLQAAMDELESGGGQLWKGTIEELFASWDAEANSDDDTADL